MTKTIIQCAMSLGIGGAETHVVELAKELKLRGHHVIVASNGGVYEKELKEAGIDLVSIPLHSKKPQYVFKAIYRLIKLFRRVKPDIVHTHARIPALYVSFLNRYFKFKMVTTVHGTFKVNPLLRLITRWGKEVFAVSHDITLHLQKHYDMRKCSITETINGIDTTKFLPNTTVQGRGIIHISRLEVSTSQTAKHLITYALNTQTPLTIYGGGAELETLKAMAAGYDHIQVMGPTDRVDHVLCKGQVFVGISRAALEAMATNMPLVLAGDYGYMGIMTPDLAQEAIATNFTCRGQDPLTYERLAADLNTVLSMPLTDFTWQRDFVGRHYSRIKMVDDYLKGYTSDKKVFIIGYYGSNNLGDELLLKRVLDLLTRHISRHQIMSVSYNTQQTSDVHNIQSVSRNSLLGLMRAIYKADVVIGGGGSMLQNATSNRSLLYYLGLIYFAKALKKEVLLIGNGIGPIRGKWQTWLVKKTLRSLDYLHVRDQLSYDWIQGPTLSHVDRGVDLAFAQHPKTSDHHPKRIVFNLRKWPKAQALCKKVAKLKERLESDGYTVDLVAMQEGNDDIIMKDLGPVLTFDSPADLLDNLSSAHLVIGMRLHFLIVAANFGIPFVALAYDPKVSQFAKELDLPWFEDFDSVTEDNLYQAVVDLEDQYVFKQSRITETCLSLNELNQGVSQRIANLFE